MARVKSPLRKRLNARWVRHIITRLAIRAFPALGKSLNIPPHSVAAIDIAAQVFENIETNRRLTTRSPAIMGVLSRSGAYDTGGSGDSSEGRSLYWRQRAVLEDCIAVGHTRMLLRAQDRALVNADGSAPNWNFGKGKRLKPVQAQPQLYLIFGWALHYYHFFANEVVLLLNFLESPYGETPLRLLVPPRLPTYAQTVLEALTLAYPQLTTEVLAPDELLTGARFLWNFEMHANHEWMPVGRATADRLVSILSVHPQIAGSAAQGNGEPLVFLSRRDAAIRRLTNEESVEAALHDLGFHTFVPGLEPFSAQFTMMQSARVVVTTHGAALTNLLFCRPGTRIVEIFPANFVKSTFAWLCSELGLEYEAVYGTPGDFKQHFSVPPEAVAAAARKAMSGPDIALV